VRSLEADGRREPGTIKPSRVRKLLRQHWLDCVTLRDGVGATTRLRWQAAAPDALWHGDICHGPALTLGGVRTPIRIYGMLDDCSRYIVALEARASERESDMQRVLTRALHLHGKPDVLFPDYVPRNMVRHDERGYACEVLERYPVPILCKRTSFCSL
jgi:transposase InsO family protein